MRDWMLMRERTKAAVRKASGERLRADMAHAAQILDSAAFGSDSMLTRAYILGALEAESSLTVRACLLTAWGC